MTKKNYGGDRGEMSQDIEDNSEGHYLVQTSIAWAVSLEIDKAQAQAYLCPYINTAYPACSRVSDLGIRGVDVGVSTA